MNNQLENPMVVGAQAAFDATFKDDETPIKTVTCPVCGAVWNNFAHEFAGMHYVWITADESLDYVVTGDNDHPVQNGFCYACAENNAGREPLRQFCEVTSRQDFAGWLSNMEHQGTVNLTIEAQDAIIGYHRRTTTGKDMEQKYRDFVEDNLDDFRRWRIERGE